MGRAPDPLSVRYEDAATGLIERAIKRADSTYLRAPQRWAVGIVQLPPGVDWERLRLAFDRALYRSPQVYHRSGVKTHSLRKPVWHAPVGRTREVRVRVYSPQHAASYLRSHPEAGMRL